MVIQVCIDDSSSGTDCLVLAGYIATAENWARLASEWHDLLTIRPAWRRFKMSEIMRHGPGDEFKERIVHHYRLIENYVDEGICVIIPCHPLRRAAQDYGMPRAVENPYLLAWRSILSVYAREYSTSEEPVDFIFDKQTEASKVYGAWEYFKANVLEGAGFSLTNRPIFRNDEEFLPLQAADLLAWCVRKQYEMFGTVRSGKQIFPWGEAKPVRMSMLVTEYTKRGIRQQLRYDREHARRLFHPTLTASQSLSQPLFPAEWSPKW